MGEDKHGEGAQTVTGFPCDGRAGDLRPHLRAAPPNALAMSPGRDGKKTVPLDVTSTCLPRKGCSRPHQKYHHGVFPHHWLDGLIAALPVLTG